MSDLDKHLAIRFALADIGYLSRRSDTGRHIQAPVNRHDEIELAMLQSRNIIRLHDDFPRYIQRAA